VTPDSFETLYGNMQRFGLALAHTLTARGFRTTRTRTQERMGQEDPEYVEAA
jgi:hypothetical protein